jgi:pimeloyl-ACP methyl ester carboxylesterase
MSAPGAPAPLRHAEAKVNGLTLHYVQAGQGPLVLFLHGFPEFWYAWKSQLLEFGRDHLAVAPDLRGYNLSAKPDGVDHYRMHHLVEDVEALADHLGHRRFVLVGHDWGGGLAWAFALAHPERLRALVILNAPHPAIFARELAENPAQQEASQYAVLLRSAQAEAALAADDFAVLRRRFFGEALWAQLGGEGRDAYRHAWSQPGALTGGCNYYRASWPDAERGRGLLAADPALFTVRVPTLVIWGERDHALLTGNLQGLDRFVPDLTLRRIPDASHWVVHEKPDEVNGFIRAFITRPAQAGP